MTRGLSIRHVWIAITLTAAFIGPASAPLGLQDILWTLVRGAWMADHGRLLDSDPFTSAPHVAGPLINVQWLADLLIHALDASGGIPLVITGTAVLVALTFGLLLAAAITASGHLRLSCVSVLVAYVLAASNLSPRPQTLAYPLFATFVLAIVRLEYRSDRRLLWLLPVLTAVWVNVHGSFFTGLALVGCAALGRTLAQRDLRAARPYVLTLGACALATLINPYGPGALVYVLTIGNNPIIRELVTEWAPTTVNWHEGVLFFASVIAVCAFAVRSRTRLSAIEILTLIAFGFLAWSSVRAIAWWGLALVPPLARVMGGIGSERPARGGDLPLVNATIIAATLLVAAMALPWTKERLPVLPADKRGLFSPDTPTGIAAYLRSHDPPATGRMFNHQGWGGYLEWATWPRHQVFVDGRFELHPDAVWLDYVDIIFPSARWRELLARYDISYVVLSRADDADLIDDLRADPTWRLDYDDELGVIFSRSDA